jgi:antirestriction protein ArdC
MSGTVYDVITNRILDSLKQNVVPWRVPWKTSAPKNYISKKPYRGINVFLLASSRFTSPWWMSYKQAASKGGQVRKGEKSTPVIFWKITDDSKDPTKKSFILRYYSVFNSTQVDGLEIPPELEVSPFSPIERCEQIVVGYKDGPPIAYGGDKAAYSPLLDAISMPAKESFESPEAFYATLFHEMTHSTGAEKRLNREGITNFDKFGSHKYSLEELVAECGSSFLCGEAGILDTTLDNSTSYIQHWISRLQSNPKWLVQAGGAAAKAADLIIGEDDTQEEEEEAA